MVDGLQTPRQSQKGQVLDIENGCQAAGATQRKWQLPEWNVTLYWVGEAELMNLGPVCRCTRVQACMHACTCTHIHSLTPGEG